MKLKDLIKTALFVECLVVVATIPHLLQILVMLMAGLIIILHGLVGHVIFAKGKVGFITQLKTILNFS
ncbi:MAG: hypothetical protein PHQ32_02655 [Firmicutes bacterium]|nr:hypothetical protein [Bacillota bacterium]